MFCRHSFSHPLPYFSWKIDYIKDFSHKISMNFEIKLLNSELSPLLVWGWPVTVICWKCVLKLVCGCLFCFLGQFVCVSVIWNACVYLFTFFISCAFSFVYFCVRHFVDFRLLWRRSSFCRQLVKFVNSVLLSESLWSVWSLVCACVYLDLLLFLLVSSCSSSSSSSCLVYSVYLFKLSFEFHIVIFEFSTCLQFCEWPSCV
jgi:hypothetical protein